MLDALRSAFYREPPPPVLIMPAEPPKPVFGPWEIKRRLDAIKEQAEDYLVSLHTPTQEENIQIENDRKFLMEFLGRDLNEKEQQDIIKSAYRCSVRVEIDPSQLFAAANTSNNLIVIDPLFVLKPSDLPSDLQLSNWGTDRDYIKKIKKWISEKFEIEEKKLSDFGALLNHYNLLWHAHPEDFYQALDFTVAHEVGHLHYQHWCINWDMPFAIILTACVTALLWSQTSLVIALACVIFIFKIMLIAARCLHALYYRKNEKAADLIAIKLLNGTEGAEIFIETCMKVENLVWGQSKWYKKLYYSATQPHLMFHLEHGSFKDRLAAIKLAHTNAKHHQMQSAQPLKA